MSFEDPRCEFHAASDGADCCNNTSNPGTSAKKSELSDEIKEIKDIVTCPIHRDIMKDPKRLSCQHAVCSECIYEYSKTKGYLICPTCRNKEKTSDVRKLQPALTEKQIIDVVNKYEKKTYLGDEEQSILYQTVPDNRSGNNIPNESFTSVNLVRDNSTEIISSRPHATMDSGQERREEFLGYELIKSDYIEDIYQRCSLNQMEDFHSSLTVFDINIVDQDPNLHQIVLVDYSNNKVVVYSDSFLRMFNVYVSGKIVKPEYVKIFEGDLIMSGQLQIDERVISLFMHCTINGEIIYQSEFFFWPESSHIPMILGFDINENDNSYYLCAPRSGKILVYEATLVECIQHYQFQGDHRPEYVAFCSTLNQLWVSCPENKQILILDLESGTYRIVTTEPIVPKMIFATDSDETIFLDSTRNRLTKIRKCGEEISSEYLHFPFMNPNYRIKTFRVLPFSKIIISTETQILIYQLKECVSRPYSTHEWCIVL